MSFRNWRAAAFPLVSGAVLAMAFVAVRAQTPAPSSLKIVVIEGEAAVNIIRQNTAVAPVVEVRDRNDLPVAGATVTFAISGGSKAAAFASGTQTLTVTTNSLGRAVAAGLHPVGSGAFRLSVQAAFQGQTATATIAQSNVIAATQAAGASSASGGGGLSHGAVAAIAGGAVGAAAVAVAATRTSASPAPAITISPAGKGIRDVTLFSFSVAGGSGTTAGYTWEFGDGARATGSAVTHTFAAEGTFQVAVTASGANESASAAVAIGSLSGTWSEVGQGQGPMAGITFTNLLTITQEAASIGGTWRIVAQPDPFGQSGIWLLTGALSSPRAVTLRQNGECLRVLDIGSVSDDLTVISGTGSTSPTCEGNRKFRFVRQ